MGRSTGRASICGGVTSGSCPRDTTTATRPRPARRCSTSCALDPARVHAMAPSDAVDDDPDRAADEYVEALARRDQARGPRRRADVRHRDARRRARTATSRRCSPSGRRCTRTRGCRRRAQLAQAAADPGHADDAGAQPRPRGLVRRLGRGEGARPCTWRCRAPAWCRSRPPGRAARARTLWLLDKAAASQLPPSLARPASALSRRGRLGWPACQTSRRRCVLMSSMSGRGEAGRLRATCTTREVDVVRLTLPSSRFATSDSRGLLTDRCDRAGFWSPARERTAGELAAARAASAACDGRPRRGERV